MRSDLKISRYSPDDARGWDEFVRSSRQPLFLLERGYMDYHSHRFADHSLVVHAANRRVAQLPLEISGDVAGSHRGLTYGGLITRPTHLYAHHVLAIFDAICDYLRRQGVKTLFYKPVPHIYTTLPAQDDIYAMFRLGATMTGCQLSTAIPLRQQSVMNMSTRQAIKAAEAAGFEARLSDDWAGFWRLLTERLRRRYDVAPVHSLEEMQLLVGRFPDNIKLFTIGREEMLAGAVVYLAGPTAHLQYISTSDEGRRLRVLPLLLDTIRRHFASDYEYLDFGGSTTDGGRCLNEGLIEQKSGMGARPVIYPEYTLTL